MNLIRFEDLTYIEPVVIQDNPKCQWKLVSNGGSPSLVGEGVANIVHGEWFNCAGVKVSDINFLEAPRVINNVEIPDGFYVFKVVLSDGSEWSTKWVVNQEGSLFH